MMWLTKKQIEKKFYLTKECDERPCNYTLHLSLTNIIDLKLGEQYTYYVTEENKNMNFSINSKGKLDNDNKYSLYYLHIWAKGNKNITSILRNAKPLTKIKDFNAYVIKEEGKMHFNYNLEINGKIGDLINIGSIFTDKTNNCPIEFEGEEFEVSGIITNNSNKSLININNLCFNFKSNNISLREINVYESAFEDKIKNYIKEKNKECLQLREYGERFFSVHFIKTDK